VSERLIQVFMADTPLHLEGDSTQEEPRLLWKVVLRTGTWKLRPGPGGVKLNAPLKIFRDKAPKGHISLAELKKNFEDGAKEYVTVPQVHADGTTSDGGFVKKLVIQDVPGENGSKAKESLLWAGLEITDSDLRKKLDEKSIRGVSGGILFDYARTEDAKKFGQILSHVMVTNSPWIGGTGDFKEKLPDGVMAGSDRLDMSKVGEVEFVSRETGDPDAQPDLPVVHLADPPTPDKKQPDAASGSVVWKPEQGFRYLQGKVQKSLREWRDALMANVPADQRYTMDWPYFSVDDVSATDSGGTALICSGYGSDQDSWVANFKLDSDGEAELDPFVSWTPAKQEWVAASEAPSTKPPARPAGRAGTSSPVRTRTSSPVGLGLREAQAARAERMRLGSTPTTGGSMSRIRDLLSRSDLQLSDEDREILLAEERRLVGFEESEAQRVERERQAEVVKYCGSPDGTTKGILDNIGLDDPGVKRYVRNALLSDDGGPAIELSEHLADGQKTSGVPRTATDLLKGFIDALPKADDGKVTLSQQARRLPDDKKPAEEQEEEKADPKSAADELAASFAEQGLGSELNLAAAKGS
jgi:hypothetical protein